jgi:hypothetical protein
MIELRPFDKKAHHVTRTFPVTVAVDPKRFLPALNGFVDSSMTKQPHACVSPHRRAISANGPSHCQVDAQLDIAGRPAGLKAGSAFHAAEQPPAHQQSRPGAPGLGRLTSITPAGARRDGLGRIANPFREILLGKDLGSTGDLQSKNKPHGDPVNFGRS